MTRSAGAGSASIHALPITVMLSTSGIRSRMPCDGSTAVTQSNRAASGVACRPVPAPTSISVRRGPSQGSRKWRNASGRDAGLATKRAAREPHGSSSRSRSPTSVRRRSTSSRHDAAQSTPSSGSTAGHYRGSVLHSFPYGRRLMGLPSAGHNCAVQSSDPTPRIDLSASERALLGRYLTNLDGRVFALKNLPEVVKGALFSRYSRTEKSLRRVRLDEFLNDPDAGLDPSRAPQ